MDKEVQKEIDEDKILLSEFEKTWGTDAHPSTRLEQIELLLKIDRGRDEECIRFFLDEGTAEFTFPSRWKRLHPSSWATASQISVLLEQLISLAFEVAIPMHRNEYDDIFLANWFNRELNSIFKEKFGITKNDEHLLFEKEEKLFLFYKTPFNAIFYGELFQHRLFYVAQQDICFLIQEFFQKNKKYDAKDVDRNTFLSRLYKELSRINDDEQLSEQQKFSEGILLHAHNLNRRKDRSFPLYKEVLEEFQKQIGCLERFKATHRSVRSRRTELETTLIGFKPKTVDSILKEENLTLSEIKEGISSVVLKNATAESIFEKLKTFPVGTVILVSSDLLRLYLLKDKNTCIDFYTEGDDSRPNPKSILKPSQHSESDSIQKSVPIPDHNIRGGVREALSKWIEELRKSERDKITIPGDKFLLEQQNSKTYGSLRLAVTKTEWINSWAAEGTLSITLQGGVYGDVEVKGTFFKGYTTFPDVTLSMPYYLYIS